MVVQKLNGSKNQVENKAIEALRDSEDDSGNLHITYDYCISLIHIKFKKFFIMIHFKPHRHLL